MEVNHQKGTMSRKDKEGESGKDMGQRPQKVSAKHGVKWGAQAETMIASVVFFAILAISGPLGPPANYADTPLVDPAGILQVYPWQVFNADQIGKSHFPLWNHLTAIGEPHMANIQTAFLYPIYWIWQAAGAGKTGYGLLLLLKLWMASIFWFVFARRTMTSFAGAVICGAAYGCGGYCLWFLQLIDVNSQMLLPLLLIFLPRTVKRPDFKSLIASAFLVFLALAGGHPEASFITVLVAVLYALFLFASEKERGRAGSAPSLGKDGFLARLIPMAMAGALGLLLCMAVLLPFINYLGRCWTMHGPGFGFFHLDPRALFNLFVPGVHRLFGGMPAEIPVEHVGKTALEAFALAYSATSVPGNLPPAGLVVAALAAAGAVSGSAKSRTALFFTGLFLVLTGLTLGLPGFNLIAFIPPFNVNSNFKFFFSEIHACLAALAGVGFDRIFLSSARGWGRSCRAWPPMAAAISVPAIALVSLAVLSSPGGASSIPRLELIAYAGLGLLVFSTLLFLAVMAPGKRSARALSCLLVLFSIYLVGKSVVPFVTLERPGKAEKSELVSRLLESGEKRQTGLDGYWPANLPAAESIKDVRSSDALFYKPYADLINEINGLSPEEGLGYFYPSYFTRPSPDRISAPAAKKLCLDRIFSGHAWIPNGVVDLALARGDMIAPAAKPARSVFDYGSGFPREAPGLFLHAPGSICFTLNQAHDRGDEGGELYFRPGFLQSGNGPGARGDGTIFIAVLADEGGKRLGYARMICPEGSSFPPVKIESPGSSMVKLSTLPGVKNDNRSDWSGFSELSWHPGGYSPPPGPVWSAGADGPFLYKVDHPPWAHLENDLAPLPAAREAGDLVRIHAGKGEGGTVVIHEAWYPGWTAEAKGGSLYIEAAPDKTSMKVRLPEGSENLTLRFVPADFRVGLFVSLVTVLVSFSLLIFIKSVKKKDDP